jgi:hypothetical protein
LPAKALTGGKEKYLARLPFNGGVSPISRLDASGNQNPKAEMFSTHVDHVLTVAAAIIIARLIWQDRKRRR